MKVGEQLTVGKQLTPAVGELGCLAEIGPEWRVGGYWDVKKACDMDGRYMDGRSPWHYTVSAYEAALLMKMLGERALSSCIGRVLDGRLALFVRAKPRLV